MNVLRQLRQHHHFNTLLSPRGSPISTSTYYYGRTDCEDDEALGPPGPCFERQWKSTSTPDEAGESKIFCFTDLPGEVRNQIYTYALYFSDRDFIDLEFAHLSDESRDEIEALAICSNHSWLEFAHSSTLTPTAKALIQVSRTVRAESISVYFSINKFRYWATTTKIHPPSSSFRNLRYDTRRLESWLAVWGDLAVPHIRTISFGAHVRPWVELQLAQTNVTAKQAKWRISNWYLLREHWDELDRMPNRSDEDLNAFVLNAIEKESQGGLRLTPLRLLALVRGLFISRWFWVSAGFAAKSEKQREQGLTMMFKDTAYVEEMK